jgi:imidazole glycerol-phosphate synthase subunit HisH
LSIVVIDYGMGNLHSVSKALESVGADVVVSSSPKDVQEAEKIVLPGVGSFAQGMQHLKELGLVPVLTEEVLEKKKLFLGICLGMHLIAESGDEGGETGGLGWIKARVERFSFPNNGFKVPHMGWNNVDLVNDSPLFERLRNPVDLYFVHSYHFVPEDKTLIKASCDYGQRFAAAVSKDNIHLFQFHPEKSQQVGQKILENFINMEVTNA